MPDCPKNGEGARVGQIYKRPVESCQGWLATLTLQIYEGQRISGWQSEYAAAIRRINAAGWWALEIWGRAGWSGPIGCALTCEPNLDGKQGCSNVWIEINAPARALRVVRTGPHGKKVVFLSKCTYRLNRHVTYRGFRQGHINWVCLSYFELLMPVFVNERQAKRTCVYLSNL